MIKHVVMWQLKKQAENSDMVTNRKSAKEKLLGLKSVIHQIDSIEVGENINPTDAAFDLVLITTHQNRESLTEYINHAAHKQVAEFISKIVSERKVVDFEY